MARGSAAVDEAAEEAWGWAAPDWAVAVKAPGSAAPEKAAGWVAQAKAAREMEEMAKEVPVMAAGWEVSGWEVSGWEVSG